MVSRVDEVALRGSVARARDAERVVAHLSVGQRLLFVFALVIFAKWSPIRCLWASLLFGGASSLGLALQTQDLISSYASYLWNTAPYVLTLVIMIITSSRSRALAGAPGVLTGGR